MKPAPYWLTGLLAAAPLQATDVAFWEEYHPARHDAEQTYLLLQFDDAPLRALGPIGRLEMVGEPLAVPDGRFGKGLRLDGHSALRCVTTNVFEGGRVSLEAWVKLERYPDKEGFIIFRPARVDQQPSYDPQVDRSKGFALLVDSRGALHMDIINTFYGTRSRTSSGPGVVPLGQWTHLAGVSGPGRRLFLDGRPVADQSIAWGQGLEVQGEKEIEPQPVYVGNNEKGDSGITGRLDQVRVHRNVHKFWAREDDGWTDPGRVKELAEGSDWFVPEHAPVVQASLDGAAVARGSAGAKVELRAGDFRPGVRGQAFAGRIAITSSNLFRADEGSLEFWMRPLGVNNLSDRNWGFVNEPFIFYLLNGGEREPTLYFNTQDGGLHFVRAPMEIHPGRWFQFVLTWRGKDIRIYADGRLAGRTTSERLAPGGRLTANRFVLNDAATPSLFDEITIYDHALLPEEAANAYWRHRDPPKLTRQVRLPSLELTGEYLPSRSTVYYRLDPFTDTNVWARVRFDLREQATVKKTWEEAWSGQLEGELKLPPLTDGLHSIAASVVTRTGLTIPGRSLDFLSRRFDWERNRLGITEEVFPPFTPVEVRGRSVGVVSRTMKMNDFGLWDEVTSLDRNLLAAPMTVRFESDSGEGRWTRVAGKLVAQKPTQAVFEAEATAEPISLRTRSTIEVDGCMKVEMTLAPGRAPTEIRRLWIDIPLQDALVPLMHTIGDGLRHNYSGAAPAGQGVVWDGSKVARAEPWRNCFVPYVWLGGPERGLAFFAENDNGWVTEKNKSKTPTHELVREGSRLTLRAYLINRPVTLERPRQLVFGVQLSPTKPMPAGWRKTVPHAPGGLAVVPWGGIQCASQGPFADDWTIVDKILEARRGRPFDTAWMSNYARQFNPPKVGNDSDWTYYMNHFASRARDVGPTRPLAVYQEEMRAAHSRPEWIVFQDEWKTKDGPAARTGPEGLDLRGGHRSFSDVSEITFPRSYADFGVFMANEWLKRGVSLYWDNTYFYPSYNTRTTAAYLAEDGHIQPALILWNARDYHKRVWHLLQYWRRQREEPLEWTLHMTNTEGLPVHTWGTVQLDHELGGKRPFSPEWLLTETIGRQVGNLPLFLYEVYGHENERVRKLPKGQPERIEWGLRAVHEIQRNGPLEKLLTGFGYGDENVKVLNYWSDQPALTVTPASVKWLALAKPASNEMLLVLASWSEEPVQAQVRIEAKPSQIAGLKGLRVLDAETGQALAGSAAEPLAVDLSGPWGNRVLRVSR